MDPWRCHLLAIDPAADFDAAARVFRRCRRVGVTPRGLADCLVVAVAWRRGASVLAQDVDVDRVCEILGVPSDPRATDWFPAHRRRVASRCRLSSLAAPTCLCGSRSPYIRPRGDLAGDESLIDLDDELLALAQRELSTTGVSDTVRAALRRQ
jgi:hypothetical protein